jgi:uncharacterized protein YjiS (DUF1127 family)
VISSFVAVSARHHIGANTVRESITMSLSPTSTFPSHDDGGLAVAISRRFRAWQERRARRVTVETLNALDDRTLSDIGLARSEILSIVNDRRNERLRRYDERWWDPSTG